MPALIIVAGQFGKGGQLPAQTIVIDRVLIVHAVEAAGRLLDDFKAAVGHAVP